MTTRVKPETFDIPINSKECALCAEERDILLDSCPNNISDHKICESCSKHLLSRDKSKPKICVFCGDRPIIVNPETSLPITTVNNYIDRVSNWNDSGINRRDNSFENCKIILCMLVIITLLNLQWYGMCHVIYKLSNNSDCNEEFNWDLKNIILAATFNYAIFIIYLLLKITCSKCNYNCLRHA